MDREGSVLAIAASQPGPVQPDEPARARAIEYRSTDESILQPPHRPSLVARKSGRDANAVIGQYSDVD